MNYKIKSRKFLFAVFFTAAGTAALFSGHLDGGQWVTLAGLVIGLYGAVNAYQKRGE